MFFLLFTVIVGTLFAILATQNALGVTVHLGPYTWANIPLYLVSLLSLIAGLLISWVLGVMGWASTSLTLRNKEQRIRSAQSTVDDLQTKIKDLEIENERLRHGQETGHTRDVRIEEPDERPHANPIERIRQSLSH